MSGGTLTVEAKSFAKALHQANINVGCADAFADKSAQLHSRALKR